MSLFASHVLFVGHYIYVLFYRMPGSRRSVSCVQFCIKVACLCVFFEIEDSLK